MTPLPGGLVNGQRRSRFVQLASGADWYIVEKGRFELVGRGDLSEGDLRAVHRELPGAVFACVSRPRPIEDALLPGRGFGARRIAEATRVTGAVRPKLKWVAKGARVAVVPGLGVRWVDGERFFRPGDSVPLPWTSPPVEMTVMRPAELAAAMRKVIGRHGPRRADSPGGRAAYISSG